jgi:C4-dicarboxylate transporter DctQ subunit
MFSTIVNRLEETLVALLLAAMTVVTFTQVVLRYVFNAGFVWALELTIFLFAWLVLFGMSYGVRVGAHIGIDLLVKTLSPPVEKLVGLIAVALCMFYAAVMTVGGYQDIDLLLLIGIEAEDLPIPLWIPKLILPLGFALLFLRFAQVGWGILTGASTGLHLANEVDEAMENLKHEQELDEGADKRSSSH